MKGIILAGGNGSRLRPVTFGMSKQMLPIYDKPLIYYPLSILMLAGIRDILIITTSDDINNYKRLLKDGNQFGIKIQYEIQVAPNGIGEAFILGKKFIGNDSVCLVLGDNVFYGQDFVKRLKRAKNNKDGATLFAYHVNNPEDFGVIIFDKKNQPKKIVEKPRKPKSNYAITGLYFYDNNVIKYAEMIKPSKRGELEITDINNIYMSKKSINIEKLGRGYAWLDTGTYKSMLEASLFVETIEKRQGFKIACLEEIALNNKWINKKQLKNQIKLLRNSEYGNYLSRLLEVDNYQ